MFVSGKYHFYSLKRNRYETVIFHQLMMINTTISNRFALERFSDALMKKVLVHKKINYEKPILKVIREPPLMSTNLRQYWWLKNLLTYFNYSLNRYLWIGAKI